MGILDKLKRLKKFFTAQWNRNENTIILGNFLLSKIGKGTYDQVQDFYQAYEYYTYANENTG